MSNRPQTSITAEWLPASCSGVEITVSMSCDQACVENAARVGRNVIETASLQVSKRYTGQTGFLDFVQDFQNTGRHAFHAGELDDPANALRLYSIETVTVFYRLGIQQTLEKLITLLPTSTVLPTIVEL